MVDFDPLSISKECLRNQAKAFYAGELEGSIFTLLESNDIVACDLCDMKAEIKDEAHAERRLKLGSCEQLTKQIIARLLE